MTSHFERRIRRYVLPIVLAVVSAGLLMLIGIMLSASAI